MSVLMKGFSAQLQCPTSLGNVEAVNQSLLGRVLFPLEPQNTRCNSHRTTHIWLARIKLYCRKPCNPNGIVSRCMANIAVKYGLVPLVSLSAVQTLLSIKNAGNFVGIYHRLPSLPSFTGIITNYKICKD